MNLEFLILGVYGQFVWPAFIFTFVSCLSLYLKTKKELQKYEKMFLNEFNELQNIEIKVGKIQENTQEALSGNSISTT